MADLEPGAEKPEKSLPAEEKHPQLSTALAANSEASTNRSQLATHD
jgi:hypothetical protein